MKSLVAAAALAGVLAGSIRAAEPAPDPAAELLQCSWTAEKALAVAKVQAWYMLFHTPCWNRAERRRALRIRSQLRGLMDQTEGRVQGSLQKFGPDLANVRLCWFYGNIVPRTLNEANEKNVYGEGCERHPHYEERYPNDVYAREEARLLEEMRARKKAAGAP